MAGVTNREFWDFRVKTRAQFTKLAEQIVNIDTSGGGGGGTDIDLTAYATKVWVEAKGYITSAALTPYALKTDIPSLVGYATEDFVNNKLNAYTTTEDLAENYASKNDLETAINNIDLSPYLKAEDAQDTYATQDYVTTKLVNYAPLTSVQGFENRIGGLEGAVPQLNERVETVESKVATLNEYVVTGDNNLLDRVNVIEEEYATKTYVDNAIDGIDLSPYLKTEDAEETYTTKDFVNNKLINYATIVSVTAIQNTLTGQIGAVDARVEQLAATKLDSSYFTLTNIKYTLGISDWALASVKPTYTASEVGALGVKDTAQQSYGLRHSTTPISDTGLHWWSGQFQVSTEPVSGKVYLGSSGDSTVISVPNIDGTSSVANACVLRLGYNREYFHEIFTSPNSNKIYHRNVHIGNGNPWRQFAFTSDIPTKLSQLTDDVVDGKYLRATIYGNFDADTLFNDGFQSGYMSHTPSGSPYGIVHTLSYRGVSNNAKTDYAAQIFIPCGDDSTSPNDMFFRTSLADSWNGWTKVITDRNIGNYNAGSATKLATPCKLWGQRFDGTGDVSGTFRQLYKGSYDGAVAHSILCNINGPYGLITRINSNGNVLQQAQRETTEVEWFNFILQPLGGNVGIGNTSPTERLDVSGNIKASGNINATSITINGVTITASNGTITVNGNVFAKGDITGGV